MTYEYKNKTDEELKQIALDIIKGNIFGSHCLSDLTDAPSVFMALNFLSKEDLDGMQKANIIFFYEYLDKAGPRSVNGMPMFYSCNMLNLEDYNKLAEYSEAFRKAIDSV